jgi:hypothetical protein
MELLRTGAADSANHPKSADARTEAILKVVWEGERFLVCSHPEPHEAAVGSALAIGCCWSRRVNELTW